MGFTKIRNVKPKLQLYFGNTICKRRTHVCQFGQATIIFSQISEIMKGRNSMVKLEVKPFFCIHQIPKLFFEVLFTTSMMSRCSQLMKKTRMGKFLYFDNLDMELLEYFLHFGKNEVCLKIPLNPTTPCHNIPFFQTISLIATLLRWSTLFMLFSP
jgi:hypothetical protein